MASIQTSLKRLEARMSQMTSHLHLSRGLPEGTNLQRQDFVAAAFRLPDGDPWKEKILTECQLTMPTGAVPQQ